MTENTASFVDKYKSRNFDDLIAPDRIKQLGKKIIKTKKLQNLLLIGNFGIGKTSFANILVDQLDFHKRTSKSRIMGDVTNIYKINAETSVLGSKYIAFIDEADQLRSDTQKDLLQYLEGEKTAIKSSILIANDISKIHAGIKSRCKVLNFDYEDEEREDVLKQVRKRIFFILDSENVEYRKQDVEDYISKYCGDSIDIRKVINEIDGSVTEENTLLSFGGE